MTTYTAEARKYGIDGDSTISADRPFTTLDDAVAWARKQIPYGYSTAWITDTDGNSIRVYHGNLP